MFHKLHVLGMNDDLWDKVHGLGSETWKGYEYMNECICKYPKYINTALSNLNKGHLFVTMFHSKMHLNVYIPVRHYAAHLSLACALPQYARIKKLWGIYY